MSTHSICFHGETKKNNCAGTLRLKKCLYGDKVELDSHVKISR